MDLDLEFFDVISFRLNKEISDKLNFLLTKYPNRYDNKSHLLRCLIIAEYNKVIYKKQKVVKNDG